MKQNLNRNLSTEMCIYLFRFNTLLDTFLLIYLFTICLHFAEGLCISAVGLCIPVDTCESHIVGVCVPVIVSELHMIAWCEYLSILQPDDMRLRNTLSHTCEHSTASCWLRHRLRPLNELWGSWGNRGTG